MYWEITTDHGTPRNARSRCATSQHAGRPGTSEISQKAQSLGPGQLQRSMYGCARIRVPPTASFPPRRSRFLFPFYIPRIPSIKTYSGELRAAYCACACACACYLPTPPCWSPAPSFLATDKTRSHLPGPLTRFYACTPNLKADRNGSEARVPSQLISSIGSCWSGGVSRSCRPFRLEPGQSSASVGFVRLARRRRALNVPGSKNGHAVSI